MKNTHENNILLAIGKEDSRTPNKDHERNT